VCSSDLTFATLLGLGYPFFVRRQLARQTYQAGDQSEVVTGQTEVCRES
jgi:hypothetical protein